MNFEFQDIDSSIHFEYQNDNSRSKIKNSPFKFYESTEIENTRGMDTDKMDHHRSA